MFPDISQKFLIISRRFVMTSAESNRNTGLSGEFLSDALVAVFRFEEQKNGVVDLVSVGFQMFFGDAEPDFSEKNQSLFLIFLECPDRSLQIQIGFRGEMVADLGDPSRRSLNQCNRIQPGGECICQSFEPGVDLLLDNLKFLLFLAAFIKGVDEYQEMLRCCVSYPGNDHRLGGNEAPPAIISIFLGDELTAILDSIVQGTEYVDITKKKLRVGIDAMPDIPQDTTDRNRTSPLAFTGNKFEFRMLGSSQSIASPNVVLNTIMTEELSQFADRLEKAENFQSALQELLQETFTAHQRIIFNGNGYDDAWVAEAARRGLANLRDTVDCMPAYIDKKNVELFTKHAVLTETEMRARYEIHLENYCKVSAIEANTLLDMAQRSILPVAARYSGDLAKGMAHKQEAGLASTCRLEEHLIRRISGLSDQLLDVCQDLSQALEKAPAADSGIEAAHYFRGEINTRVRQAGDLISQLESLVDAKMWPYPTYADILFGV